jgi:hypothetical protein
MPFDPNIRNHLSINTHKKKLGPNRLCLPFQKLLNFKLIKFILIYLTKKGRNCLGVLYDNALFLYIVLSIVLILTATFKCFIQIMQLVFFKSDFLTKLIRMHATNDVELYDSFEVSKRKILEMNVQNAMHQNGLNSPLRDTRLAEAEEDEDSHESDDAFESESKQHDENNNNLDEQHLDENRRYVNAANEIRYVNSGEDET